MEDLKAIFNGGVVFALYGVAGWMAFMLLIFLLGQLLTFIGWVLNGLISHVRYNPYIMAHQKLLKVNERYNDYVEQAVKDGVPANEIERE